MTHRTDIFGHAPLCNRRPERALTVRGFVFPMCWRCMGIASGMLAAMTTVEVLGLQVTTASSIALASCAVPGLLDVALQDFAQVPSTNPRRLITGILAGLAVVGCACLAAKVFTTFVLSSAF